MRSPCRVILLLGLIWTGGLKSKGKKRSKEKEKGGISTSIKEIIGEGAERPPGVLKFRTENTGLLTGLIGLHRLETLPGGKREQ